MANKQVTQIRKRDGSIVLFNQDKITEAIFKAAKSVGGEDKEVAKRLSGKVVGMLNSQFKDITTPTVEQVSDIVERVLIKNQFVDTSKAFILYRYKHKEIRNVKESVAEAVTIIDNYVSESDWRVKENSNMAYSLQGLNNHITTTLVAKYWLNKLYPEEQSSAHKNGDIHIHNLGVLGPYCVGWDIKDIIMSGFGGVTAKTESKPPKHLKTALGQIVNFFYTLQGEVAGANALSNFDTYLAPFIRFDKLSYKEVKQAVQEFMFNMNVPTRVGFQCLSKDTEILTIEGWKTYDQISKGTIIKTFNCKKNIIEDKKVKSVFKKKYKGIMYNLKNRIQDQLISPKHRVVRKKFQTNKFVLEPIEDVAKLKSSIIIPICANNNNKEEKISDQQIKLMAWIIGEGSIEKPGKHRSCYRISIYQSAIKNKNNYKEIKRLLNHFKLKFSEYTQKGLGQPVQRMRLNAESSKKIHNWFECKRVDFIPKMFLNMSQKQSKLFIETYIKAEGFEDCKITTTNIEILNDLQAIACNAGYGSTVLERKLTIGTKKLYVLRLIKHQDTYINSIKKINYSGIIWCPNTDNETVVARRNGKVFITGNTPFTNITMDLKVPEFIKNEPVIIGGKLMTDTYESFQKEMDTFNKAFAEVMMEGDAKGRVFTFPIPTYNITKDFDWDNENLNIIWEMTAKYGIPYFSNFINSDMKPDDVRSMCCRLRLDKKELEKRGGGLFGSNPLTGSIGVVTINLARIGFLAKNEQDYFERLERLMTLAKKSLETKRKSLERFTEGGLYPYSQFYLRNVYKRDKKYWTNHFSTIGVLGMNESLLNFLGCNISSEKGKRFTIKVMDFMRYKLSEFQNETGSMYNLEATPAEGASYRFSKKDKGVFPKIIVANEEEYMNKGAAPYYTNSTQLPINHTNDIFEALELQDEIQCKYTGGTVLHGFLGERVSSPEATKILVRKIAENFSLPYYTLTPTFSVCPKHGYLNGEQKFCPKCDSLIGNVEENLKKRTRCEIYSRVVGYLRPVQFWNTGKRAEFFDRKTFDEKISLEHPLEKIKIQNGNQRLPAY